MGSQTGTTYSIGEVARRSGVKIETIRFYERSGLACRNAWASLSMTQGPPIKKKGFVEAMNQSSISLRV